MNRNLLIAHRWKILGWLLTIPSLIGGLIYLALDESEYLAVPLPGWLSHFLWVDRHGLFSEGPPVQLFLLDELISLSLLIGLLLLAFSREKIEDEWINQVRLESFQWAILVNALLLMGFILFAHGMPFFTVMVYNMFTPLLIFVGRFYYILRIKPLYSKD